MSGTITQNEIDQIGRRQAAATGAFHPAPPAPVSDLTNSMQRLREAFHALNMQRGRLERLNVHLHGPRPGAAGNALGGDPSIPPFVRGMSDVVSEIEGVANAIGIEISAVYDAIGYVEPSANAVREMSREEMLYGMPNSR